MRPKERPVDSGAPKLTDFDDIEKYADAKAEYESKRAIQKYEAERMARAQQQDLQSLSQTWEKKVEKAESKYADFYDVVGDFVPNPALPMTVAIAQAENGDDIAYYLGQNRNEAIRIMQMDHVAQIREIGRLEAKLLADPPKAKKLSEAPKPIKPVTGSESGSAAPSERDEIGTWIKKRQKEVHAR